MRLAAHLLRLLLVGLWEGGLRHGSLQRTLQLWVLLLLLSTPQLLLLTAEPAGQQS